MIVETYINGTKVEAEEFNRIVIENRNIQNTINSAVKRARLTGMEQEKSADSLEKLEEYTCRRSN